MMERSVFIIGIFICCASIVAGQQGRRVDIVASEAILGEGSVSIRCEFTAGTGDFSVSLGMRPSSNPNNTVTYIIKDNDIRNATSVSQADRYSFIVQGGTALIWTITNPTCEEEGTYVCTYSYIPGTNTEEFSSSTNVVIKARPGSVTLTNLTSVTVKEGASVEFQCVANIGRPSSGSIVWRIGVVGPIDITDSRVSSVKNPDPTRSCTSIETSTLNLSELKKADQGLVVSCYLVNTDFLPETPGACQSQDMYCGQGEAIEVQYSVKTVTITPSEEASQIYVGDTLTLTCIADAVPPATFIWVKEGDENRTFTAVTENDRSRIVLRDLNPERDSGEYNCTAVNNVGDGRSISYKVTVVPRPTIPPTEPPTTTTPPDGSTEPSTAGDSDDETTIIIVVVVVVVVVIIVVVLVLLYCKVWKNRNNRKEIEEPPEKPFNNRTNLSFQSSQPDLVADDKKFTNPSLNNSFDPKNEDGLMYADLTYDNRPRSRKPMAIGDAASEYSDVQMPQV